MSKRKDAKMSLSDVLSGLGVASSGLTALAERGVGRTEWSRLVSDGAFADRIAAAMLGKGAEPSLNDLIAEAKTNGPLQESSPSISSKRFPEIGVRGELVEVTGFQLDLETHFSTEMALNALDRRGYLSATMYELVCYAIRGWDGETYIVALGSLWRSDDDHRYGGSLGATFGEERTLDLVCADWKHSGDTHFLAVHK